MYKDFNKGDITMATKKIKMNDFSVFGDLDGMTVGNLKKMLDSYPDDAKIVGKTESNPPFRWRIVYRI